MSSLVFLANPAAESHRQIDFDRIAVNPGIVPGTYFLTVSGSTPCINMKVELAPLVYVSCPEYWGIEVIACLPSGTCLEAIGSFAETVPLAGITGSKGIEVIGATRREQVHVEGGCSAKADFANVSVSA